ncbi:carboxy terminal-processing peptidase [Pontibacter sp. G13]|uniref:carboxy terminal-processing peptidase n=1 Tax=Pontibacter sp. G13 TaxID=3074898 RepID=UPI00288A7089|nr:carboxy terminal-processing peptidase [Pontibacter sp. G13]WNJ19996.1 carboxy terminal-processing peptidase [Pontibacter sp. G13]
MKLRILLSSAVVAAVLMLSSYTFYTGGGERGGVLLQLMMRGMEFYHYQPQKVDDEFSKEVFDDYITRIDYNKRFLMREDIDKLQAYRLKVDDEVNNLSFEMFDLSVELLAVRIREAEGVVNNILSEPFDFDKSEVLDTDYEHMEYASNSDEIRERWRKQLKYQVLARLVSDLERQEKAQESGSGDIEIKSFDVLEEESRGKIKDTYEDFFRRLKRLDSDDRRADYMNSIAAVFDPHTGYFPPIDKENFDISMSGKLEGIGAQLREDNGYIKVVRIVPGSPSAKQGQLKVNDLILKVAQGDAEPVDVVDMDINDVVKKIRGKKGTEVRLTVRKMDGSETIIPIIRDLVQLEETYAKSVMLKNGKNKAYGYIDLPKFYADFQDRSGRFCSKDVATEIQKLKAEGMNGLIIDLRDNGGGALQEVVKMAGLFIPKGPIVQVKGRTGEPQVLSDKDGTVLYDGPLVILVNSFSASASEIMAAAIQDYDRGVIVGSQSTFGKGTVQRFENLDNFIRGGAEFKPLGSMKLTTQKFYRINGGTTQLKGVESDVILPDEYSLVEMGEKDQKHSMPWDEISPVGFELANAPVNDRLIKKLQTSSRSRVADSDVFSQILENAQLLKSRQDDNEFPLQLEAFRAERKRTQAQAEQFKDLFKVHEDLDIATLQADADYVQSDSSRIARTESWHEGLSKDPYVYEALQIIQEMK